MSRILATTRALWCLSLLAIMLAIVSLGVLFAGATDHSRSRPVQDLMDQTAAARSDIFRLVEDLRSGDAAIAGPSRLKSSRDLSEHLLDSIPVLFGGETGVTELTRWSERLGYLARQAERQLPGATGTAAATAATATTTSAASAAATIGGSPSPSPDSQNPAVQNPAARDPAIESLVTMHGLIESIEQRIITRRQQLVDASSMRLRVATTVLIIAILSGILGLGLIYLQGKPLAEAESLEQQKSLLAAAVSSSDDGMLISDIGEHDEEPKIVFANDSAMKMTGFQRDEIVGASLRRLQESAPSASGEHNLFEQSFSKSNSTRAETVMQRKDGWKFNCEWHICPVRRNGTVTHFVASMRDISERKQQEIALQRKTDELEDANRSLCRHQEQLIQQEKMASLGQLAAGVAHEIKNPVAYVSSHLENLEEDFRDLAPLLLELARADDEPETKPGTDLKAVRPTRQQLLARLLELDLETTADSIKMALEDSRDGIERIQQIANSLRKFSRPTDDEPTELARLEDVIEDALRITQSQLKSRCELFRHYGNLKPIACRPRQLTQVITNLLVNAAQAIPKWGKVTVSTAYEDDDAVIRVSDTGTGIRPEHLKELFTPFFTTKPGSVGTGLGLSISYGIVKGHGGTITVHSVHGDGTTFEIRLPLSAAMEVKLPAEG